MNVTPPEVPMPGIAGGEKRKCLRFGNCREPLVETPHDDVGGQSLSRARPTA